MSYIPYHTVVILRDCWFDISVENFHAPIEDEIADMKDGYNDTLQYIFNKLL
jgi:hypothetical protein